MTDSPQRVEGVRRIAATDYVGRVTARTASVLPPGLDPTHPPLTIEAVPQAIGATRYFFRCPGCDKRRTWLAVLDGVASCRECCELRYTSRLLSTRRRRIRSAAAIYDRINVKHAPGVAPRQGPKPPQMHWLTYWRLYDAAVSVDPFGGQMVTRYRYGRGLGRRTVNLNA